MKTVRAAAGHTEVVPSLRLQEVFKQSDFVICSLPGGEATYHACGVPRQHVQQQVEHVLPPKLIWQVIVRLIRSDPLLCQGDHLKHVKHVSRARLVAGPLPTLRQRTLQFGALGEWGMEATAGALAGSDPRSIEEDPPGWGHE